MALRAQRGGDRTYAVVGALHRRRDAPAKSQRFEPDPKGALLREHKSRCELIGPAREVFDYPVDGIAAPTLRALAQDAMRRYPEAFGGTGNFRAALARGKREADLANPRSVVLREAVEQAAWSPRVSAVKAR